MTDPPVTRDEIYGQPISDEDLMALLRRALDHDQDDLAIEISEILDQ